VSTPTIVTPHFSVVIPTFQRPQHVRACLEALALQDYPWEQFEVLIVDDGSANPPRDIVASYSNRLRVRLIEQANAGPAAARNGGAAAALGAYVVFTDDDCRPEPQWLSSLASCTRTFPDAAVGGRVANALPHRLCSAASQHLIDFLYRFHNATAADSRFLITSNLLVPRGAFLALGGFDISFSLAGGEDRDLCERWCASGQQMAYCPKAVILHAHDLRLATFWRQHYNYGRGAHHLHRARARRGTNGFRLESLRFYSQLLCEPFQSGVSLRTARLSALMLLSQIAYAVGYASERYNDRRIGHGTARGVVTA
jgi:GT2 family glycosyltransferase